MEIENRRLAAILFADIQGYTALMQANEQLALSSLKKFKTQLDQKVPTHNGDIINFYGDGCLAIFNSSVDATACAKSLQLAFQAEPKVPVRIGLHAGDVVLRDDNVFGDAVNIASRIESMGVSGSVLLSSTVQNQIHNQSSFDVSLIGKFEFKNVNKPMSVYALKGEGLIVPEKGELKGKQKITSQRNLPKGLLIPLILFSVIAIGTAIIMGLKNQSKPKQTVQGVETANEKSIAVLPFKNFSGDDELEFFCDGMTDEVISRLNNITALDKVISRTTVFKYKNSIQTLREIASELGVNHVLESSFQKAGDQIRIKFNLVEVKTENSIWDDEITGTWNSDDVFTIQSKVAENVASNMNLNLSPKEVASIQEAPTDNKVAYNLFLQAEFQRNKANIDAFKNAIPLYEEVLRLDPSFVEAYISLADLYSFAGLVWGFIGEQEAWEKTKELLTKANQLDPDNLAIELTLRTGNFYFDWDFDTYEPYYYKRLNMDKYNISVFGDGIADYAIKTSRYEDALFLMDKWIEENPSFSINYSFQAQTLWFNGETKKAKAILEQYNPMYKDDQWYLREIVKLYYYMEEYDQARAYHTILKENFSDRAPIHIWFDLVFNHRDGTLEEVEANLQEIKARYDEGTSGSPAWFMAMSYAVLGQDEKVIAWLQKSYDLHEVEMTWLKEEPLLKPYRDHPVYKFLYQKMGWPKAIKD